MKVSVFQWSNKFWIVLKFFFRFSVESFSKHPQTCHNILNATTLCFEIRFFLQITWFCVPLWFRYQLWLSRNASPLRDQHEYIFSCVEFGKVQKRKNITEVPWLVLLLYNKMSIRNSFVKCPIVFMCDLWPVTCTLAPPSFSAVFAYSTIGFCTLCFCFPTKMLHLNAPFFLLKCLVSSKKSLKCSDNAHYTNGFF